MPAGEAFDLLGVVSCFDLTFYFLLAESEGDSTALLHKHAVALEHVAWLQFHRLQLFSTELLDIIVPE